MSKKMRPQRNVQAPPRFADFVEFTSSSDDVSNSLSRRGMANVQPTGGSIQEDLQSLATSMSIFREQSTLRPTTTTLHENATIENIGGLISHTTSVLNGGDVYPTHDQSIMDMRLILGQNVALSTLNTHEQQTSEKNWRGNDYRDLVDGTRDFFNSEIPIETSIHRPSSVPNPVRRDVLLSTVEERGTRSSSPSIVLPRANTGVRAHYELNIAKEMENLFNDEIVGAQIQKVEKQLLARNEQQENQSVDRSQTCSITPSIPLPGAPSPMSPGEGHGSEAAIGNLHQPNTNLNESRVTEDDEHTLNNDEHGEQLIIQKDQQQISRPNDNGHDNHECGSISTASYRFERPIVSSVVQCSTKRSDQLSEKAVMARTEQQACRDQDQLLLQLKVQRQAHVNSQLKSSGEYVRENLPIASSGVPPSPENTSSDAIGKKQQPNTVLRRSRENADNERFLNTDERGEQSVFPKDQLQKSRPYNNGHDNRRGQESVPISTLPHSFIGQQTSGTSSTQCSTARSAGDGNHQPPHTTVGRSCYDDNRGGPVSQLAGSNWNGVPEQFFYNLLEVLKAHNTMCKEEFGVLKQQIKKLKGIMEREVSGEFPQQPERLPISTRDSIMDVETISTEEYKQIVGYLAALGGVNINETVNEILKHTITDFFSPEVTWYGREQGSLELGKTRVAKAMYAATAKNRAFSKPTWAEFSSAMIAALKCSKQRNRVAERRQENVRRVPNRRSGRRRLRSTGDETRSSRSPRDETHNSRSPRGERRTSRSPQDKRRKSRNSRDERRKSRSSRDERRKSRSSRDETDRSPDSRGSRRRQREIDHEENRPAPVLRRRHDSGKHERNSRDAVEAELSTESDI